MNLAAAGSPKLLWIATKPPWPPRDGGRLLQLRTLEALVARGVDVTLVAPVAQPDGAARAAALEEHLAPRCRVHLVRLRRRSWSGAAVAGLLAGLPVGVARHRSPEVVRAVRERVAADRFDAVHVEQLQALPQAAPALSRGLPVVLRAQNVESDLWSQAVGRRSLRLLPARLDGRRLARWEGAAVRRVAATTALSEQDAEHLRALAHGGGRVEVVRAPFPARLPAGEPLPGRPAVVVLGGGGWLPNREGVDWFASAVWPALLRRSPQAVLHLYGAPWRPSLPGRIVVHPHLEDSRAAFPEGGVLMVPLRIASGVRMKILEAWARGVPVVATPEAVAGLGCVDGRELRVRDTVEGISAAVAEVAERPDLAAALVAGGRRLLCQRHDPARIAAELCGLYAGVGTRRTG